MQSDTRGKGGDVRDVIIHTQSGEVGVSAKHRHKAAKHPRLSPKIDFGLQWYGRPCSENYWRSINPIFDTLIKAKNDGKMWRDLPDKVPTIYAPIIRAFIDEVRSAPATPLLLYMLGKYDYYKVVKDNGNVVLQSFNLRGSLKWGNRLVLPRRVIDIEHIRDTTAIITFDKGWSLSFRLHNAESRIVPSVKFDVTLVGTPPQANHIIKYR